MREPVEPKSIVMCKGTGHPEEFASKDDLANWIKSRLEDILDGMDIGIFIGGVDHTVKLSVSIVRGRNSCSDCKCIFDEV